MSTSTSRYGADEGVGAPRCGADSTRLPVQRLAADAMTNEFADSPPAATEADILHDLCARRRELNVQLRSCRYMRRLVRSHLDLAIARATLTRDDDVLGGHPRVVARSAAVMELVLGGPVATMSLHDLVRLVQDFDACERELVAALDELTESMVERLSADPSACLPTVH